jgi:uncharacterized membrane protein YdjX (TVP38/TMEM64 family)
MRLLLWFVVLALLVLGTWLRWGGAWEDHFTLSGSVHGLESAGAWAWAAGVLLLAADLLLPIPSTLVIAGLGYLYGVVVGGLLAAVGLSLSGFLGYGLGRLCGERFARRLLGENDYALGERLFVRGGAWLVAMSRALPIFPEIVSCTAGLVRMPFKRFALALVCGSLPMGLVFAAIGEAGQDAPGWALGLSVAVPGLLWWLASRWRRMI